MISKQLRAVKKLVSIEELYRVKRPTMQIKFHFGMSKQELKALFAYKYIDIITLLPTQPSKALDYRILIPYNREMETAKRLQKLFDGILSFVPESQSSQPNQSMDQKQTQAQQKPEEIIAKQKQKLIKLFRETIKGVVISGLSQMQITDIVENFLKEVPLITYKTTEASNILREVLKFDPKLVMNQLQLKEAEKIILSKEQKKIRAKLKLERFFNQFLKFPVIKLNELSANDVVKECIKELQPTVQPNNKLKRILKKILKFDNKSVLKNSEILAFSKKDLINSSPQKKRITNFIDEVLTYNPMPTLSHSEIIEVVENFLKGRQFQIRPGQKQILRDLFKELLSFDVRSFLNESQIKKMEETILTDIEKKKMATDKLSRFLSNVLKFRAEPEQNQLLIENFLKHMQTQIIEKSQQIQKIKALLRDLLQLHPIATQTTFTKTLMQPIYSSQSRLKQRLSNFLAEILTLNVNSTLNKSSINEIVKNVQANVGIPKGSEKLKELVNKIVQLDVNKILEKLAIKPFEQREKTDEGNNLITQKKLEQTLIEALKFDGVLLVSQSLFSEVVENVQKRLQQKRVLLDEIMNFDLQSILPSDLVRKIDDKLMQEVKSEMQAYFTEGVILDSAIFTQDRFSEALNQTQKQKFSFYPTFTITGQIFTAISFHFGRTLIYGHRGISKSISIILRVLLQNQITRYLVKKKRNKVTPFLNGQTYHNVKIFYFNMKPITNLEQKKVSEYAQSFGQSLVNQCFEDLDEFTIKQINDQKNRFFLTNKELQSEKNKLIKINQMFQNCKSFVHQIASLLKKFYHSLGLKVRVIVDQINSLYSHIRIANLICSNNKDFQNNPEWVRESGIANFLAMIVNCLIDLSSYDVFFNSSINIEQQYMRKNQQNPDWLFVELHGRQSLPCVKISFNNNEIKHIRDFEMTNFFKFQLKRIGKQFKYQINEYTQLFKESIQKTESDQVTPLLIRQVLNKYHIKLNKEKYIIKFVRCKFLPNFLYYQNIQNVCDDERDFRQLSLYLFQMDLFS